MKVNARSTRQAALFISWIIALIAVLGAEYAGRILHFPICHLCWYQRIFMYPIAVLGCIACYRNDFHGALYMLPLAVGAAIIALVQYLQQMIPSLSEIKTCQIGPSCQAIHMKLFGFITFPFASLVASTIMVILLLVAYETKPNHSA